MGLQFKAHFCISCFATYTLQKDISSAEEIIRNRNRHDYVGGGGFIGAGAAAGFAF